MSDLPPPAVLHCPFPQIVHYSLPTCEQRNKNVMQILCISAQFILFLHNCNKYSARVLCEWYYCHKSLILHANAIFLYLDWAHTHSPISVSNVVDVLKSSGWIEKLWLFLATGSELRLSAFLRLIETSRTASLCWGMTGRPCLLVRFKALSRLLICTYGKLSVSKMII